MKVEYLDENKVIKIECLDENKMIKVEYLDKDIDFKSIPKKIKVNEIEKQLIMIWTKDSDKNGLKCFYE